MYACNRGYSFSILTSDRSFEAAGSWPGHRGINDLRRQFRGAAGSWTARRRRLAHRCPPEKPGRSQTSYCRPLASICDPFETQKARQTQISTAVAPEV